MSRLIGRVLFFRADKGFGFVRTPAMEEIFFHVKEYKEFDEPKRNIFVTFELKDSRTPGKPHECADVRLATAEEIATLTLGGAKC